VAEIADAVWDELIAGHAISGSTGEALSAAGSAGDPWTTALPGAYSAGTAGYIVGTNVNALITSRMATYTQPTGFLAATFPTTVASTTNITAASGVTLTATTGLGNQTADITGSLSGSVGSVTGAVGSVTGAVGSVTGAVGSVTGNVGGNVTGSVGSVLGGINTTAGVITTLDALDTAQDVEHDATQAAIADVPTNAELATAIITGLTTAIAEGYRSTNSTGSVRDILYEMLAALTQFGISGTLKTTKKLDGTTTAKTYTFDDATNPTSSTETT
jgi:hypothetical protein